MVYLVYLWLVSLVAHSGIYSSSLIGVSVKIEVASRFEISAFALQYACCTQTDNHFTATAC